MNNIKYKFAGICNSCDFNETFVIIEYLHKGDNWKRSVCEKCFESKTFGSVSLIVGAEFLKIGTDLEKEFLVSMVLEQ